MTDPDSAPSASTTRPADQVLADAVRVLTEAARLTRSCARAGHRRRRR